MNRVGAPLIFLFAGLAAAPAAAQQAGSLRSFKDWVVGCDNIKGCVALGLSPRGEDDAYLKIARGGGAGDEPSVLLKVLPDRAPASARLGVAIDGAPVRGLGPLAASTDDPYVSASLSPEATRSLIAALREAKAMTVTLTDGDQQADVFDLSLAGSSAALLFMDDAQGRVGGVTALAKAGSAPASDVPAAPRAPRIKATAMSTVDSPGPVPPGVSKAKDASCRGAAPLAFRLSGGKTLWGVCAYAAAYNFGFDMWIVGRDGAVRGRFETPGSTSGHSAEMTNPALSDDGSTLDALDKGRGVGDCGEAVSWAWDGAAFRLARLARFDDCRGVSPDDWPTLYRAEVGSQE